MSKASMPHHDSEFAAQPQIVFRCEKLLVNALLT